ncbi:hypothetical protein [Bradyrhizobium tropiciagri]|uniref:hypothetical protein n=1 Tax=Bradyrhizobium tropiciagri TaxID=312253 RepID=UPI00067CC92D|nr:hypothetical protein [Bradyrhizobium tropiciagri]
MPATIILVGVAENISQLIADHESIRRALTPIKLERMMDFELSEIIDTRLKLTPFQLGPNVRNKIIKLSYGLPYYVHMLGKQAFKVAAIKKQLSITNEVLNSAMDEFLEDTEQFYYDDYHNAVTSNQTDSQFREVLLACAMANRNESGLFSATSVIEPLSQILEREVKHANFQRHLTEFMSDARGPILIRRGSVRQRRYRFTDPMMQPYILMRGIREGLIPEASFPADCDAIWRTRPFWRSQPSFRVTSLRPSPSHRAYPTPPQPGLSPLPRAQDRGRAFRL